MPTIEFTKDAEFVVATEMGGRKTEKIKAGTIMNVGEGTAGRWERRGVAKRLTGTRTLAPVEPEAPTAPGTVVTGESKTVAPPPPPPPAGDE